MTEQTSIQHDFSHYQTLAEQGDPEAQYQLGLCYAQGLGVEKNFREAARYWLMASKQNHAYALLYLGKLFEKGAGIPKDYTKAYQCYQVASQHNLSEGKVRLGMLYLQGLGVERSAKKAVNLFIQGAEQGDVVAQYNLAIAYEKGMGGLSQNTGQAIFWYQQAVNQDYEPAKKRLERIGMTNETTAEEMFKQGVDKLQHDLKKAFAQFEQSAQQNFAKAQYNMGIAYAFGLADVETNLTKSVAYLQKSAKQNYRNAHFLLGWLYQTQQNLKDEQQALMHYKKASELGHAQAQYALYQMYATGNGVTKNPETALMWLRQSAKQGYGVAYQRLQQLIP
ncbi:hypothetical protein MOMA_01390 [Moraxella macacae 0408225]|uniref:Sel1 domain-containing protein n=1 Tax=Moraxella macacae 0408225 TaxID=1230338 RepID=L2F8C7_9GAMM|nr:SEL1-like repeat protein [Moraxella macacae]ELA09021.1 hypothetical protein MOMA_01390 [Moraxella macacae 0408225]